MNSDEQDLINSINRKKSQGFSFFNNKELLNSVYGKVVNKEFRINENKRKDNMSNNNQQNMSGKADLVMRNDRQVRESVQNLIMSLVDLGDKDIALKLLGEHIIMMSQAFKEFEK
jgi:hypothetical protein